MKVTLQKDYKNIYTLAELETAKMVIAQEREDEETPAGWAEYAVREALKHMTDPDYFVKVLEATAETQKNCRATDLYFPGSGEMDVFITATARTSRGFIEVGAYLSDIWQSGAVDFRHCMYANYYKRVEIS